LMLSSSDKTSCRAQSMAISKNEMEVLHTNEMLRWRL
jgi:hypothetical protein